jgi:hypothetical protein
MVKKGNLDVIHDLGHHEQARHGGPELGIYLFRSPAEPLATSLNMMSFKIASIMISHMIP